MNTRFAPRLLITSLLLVAPVAMAQEPLPPGPPEHRGPGMFRAGDPKTFAEHRLKFMTEMLSLTDDQQKQATTIFTDEATSAAKVQEQLKTAHENLRTAVKNKNTAAVDQGAVAIGSLTAQMIATREKSKIAFAKILTPEQQAKLDKFESEGPGHMGPMPPRHSGMKHGPGMPPPPHRPDTPEGPDGPGGGAEPPAPGDYMY